MLSESVLNSIARQVSAGLKGENRKTFLKTLRQYPDNLSGWISENLQHWGTVAVVQTCEAVVVGNPDEATTQVLKYFQTHFASEISRQN